jgi:flagella basal body P-ring formation protein FlgA
MKHFILAAICFLLVLPICEARASSPQARDAEIRAAVENYVRQKTAGLGCEIRIKRLSLNDSSALPDGPLEYEIVAPRQWEGWGSASITVMARNGERLVRNMSGRVEVEALAEMVISARQIDHGSIVTAGDVALTKLDVSVTQGHYLGSVKEAVGKKARSTIRLNSPIKPDQLEKVALIKSGQIVTVVAENDRMRVTLTGKARSSGGEGDTITVQNINSLKEFPALIVNATTVMVAF